MTDENTAAAAAEPQAQGPQFNILKIYIKDISYEAPNTPQIFNEQAAQPQVDTQLGNQAATIAPGVHEVVLSVTITMRVGDRVVYLVEVKQAGIFGIQGIDEQQLPAVLATVCPNILFPYAREAVSDTIVRGGFPQLLLPPVNFDILYQNQLAQRQQAAQAAQPLQ
jgi:preprotein translocase subunit SecB